MRFIEGFITPDGKVTYSGIDNGPMTLHEVIKRGDDIWLVIKCEGHHRWGDRLHPSVYEPVRFEIVRLLKRKLDGLKGMTIEVDDRDRMSFPLRAALLSPFDVLAVAR